MTENGNGLNGTEKILDTVKKLLNMTVENGCSEAEATTAMEMAQSLLFKYNLEMADVINFTPEQRDANRIIGKDWDDDTHVRLERGYGQPVEWMIALGFAVGRWSFCKALASSYSVTFIGRKVDVEVTKEMFRWILEQCKRISEEETEKFKKARAEYYALSIADRRKLSETHPYHGLWEDPRRWKNNFLHGMVERLDTRLMYHWKELKNQSEKSTALVVVTETAIKEYMDEHYPKIGEHKGPDISFRGHGYNQGYKAADKVSLSRATGVGTRQQLPG
jgi:hypothetical protein